VTAARRVRVLVVDDSAFARKVLREALSASPQLEVVGIARDGLEALERIAELAPDVVTLDLVMPNLDGLGVLRALRDRGGPRVVIVSISNSDSALGIEALEMGAVDLVQKPTALATDRLYELSGELVAKVIAAAGSRPRAATAAVPPRPLAPATSAVRLIVVGTSTGGPQALTRLLTGLPPELPCAVAVALHIPPGYTAALAQRLDAACEVRVFEATDGAALLPGTVAIAPGGSNLRIGGEGSALSARVDSAPTKSPFCPSVDALFESAAVLGPAALGVVMTGMGSDGVDGARAIKAAAGRIFTEAEGSCVVYGMPRAVVEAGLSDAEVRLETMAQRILASL
jgi:two-component system chemotaxis response regulator CheB